MAAAGGVRGSEPGKASASGSASDTSLLGSATVWHLKRYGRFLPPKDGDDEGRSTSWKVPAARGGWPGVGLLALLVRKTRINEAFQVSSCESRAKVGIGRGFAS